MISSVQGISTLSPLAVEAAKLQLSDENRVLSQELSPQNSQQQSTDAEQGTLNGKEETKKVLPPSPPNFSGISSQLQSLLKDNTSVQFSIDEQTKQIVLKIIDNKTKEIVRQLPPEESLRIAQYITGRLEQGKVTDAKI